MEKRTGTALARVGGTEWERSLYVAMGTVFAICCAGLLIVAAVLRSLPVLSYAGGAAFGILVAWQLFAHASQYTLVYPYELIFHNRKGAYASVLRGSVTSFRIDSGGEEAAYVVAHEIDGRKSKVVGSDLPHGPVLARFFAPKRSVDEIKSKLDNWLRDGRYR
nr:hypothetical protein [Rhodococcus sp. (in: high G+C Gram-positive bacteria)]